MRSLGSLLLVDDEPEVLDLLRDYLAGEGYSVMSAVNGRDALVLASLTRPDAVLLDIRMPGMQGPDVVRELQALDPTISVVMVSGTDDEDLARELLKAGALDYVRKPFALEALREVVQVAVLTGKRPRPAAAKPPRGRHAGGAGPSPAEALDGRCPICGEAVATTDTAAVCDGGAMFHAVCWLRRSAVLPVAGPRPLAVGLGAA